LLISATGCSADGKPLGGDDGLGFLTWSPSPSPLLQPQLGTPTVVRHGDSNDVHFAAPAVSAVSASGEPAAVSNSNDESASVTHAASSSWPTQKQTAAAAASAPPVALVAEESASAPNATAAAVAPAASEEASSVQRPVTKKRPREETEREWKERYQQAHAHGSIWSSLPKLKQLQLQSMLWALGLDHCGVNKPTAIERLTSYLFAGGVLPLPEAAPLQRESALTPRPTRAKLMPVMSSIPAAAAAAGILMQPGAVATISSGVALTTHHQTCISTHDVLKTILVDGTVQLRDSSSFSLLHLVQGLIRIGDEDRQCLPSEFTRPDALQLRQEFQNRIDVARSPFAPMPTLAKAALLLSLAVVQQDCLEQRLEALAALQEALQLVSSKHACPWPQDSSPGGIWLQAFLCRLESRLGSAHRLTKDVANALKFGLTAYERASQFRGSTHFRGLRASVACLLGIAYRRNDQLQEASECTKEAVSLFEGVDDAARLQWATAELIRIHMARQEFPKAQALLTSMHRHSNTSLCSQVGFYKLAFEYFKEKLYVPHDLFRSDLSEANQVLQEADKSLAKAEQLLQQPHAGLCRCQKERIEKSREWVKRKKSLLQTRTQTLHPLAAAAGTEAALELQQNMALSVRSPPASACAVSL
jgi:tetratricopeptide (TPR) repeat protein